jgi:tellurite resistance protein
MAEVSSDVIEQEMQTVIFYLTAFAYIDGNFDERERAYITEFINRLTAYRARLAIKGDDVAFRDEQTAKWTAHFQSVFEETDHQVREYFTESVAEGEDTREFVVAKLKLRCYELFKQFNYENQSKLLLLADELANADGEVHPSEAAFRDELRELLASTAEQGPPTDEHPVAHIVIEEPTTLVPRIENYDFFRAFEYDYAVREKATFDEQIRMDMTLVDKTMAKFEEQRAKGRGMLAGKKTVADLAGTDPFLDDFVHVIQPQPGKEYELLVLGDLHGCYSCLKAALLQSDFFAKVDAHHLDPSKPAMKLVLLGDYIDRGRYSYNGILRTLMQLYLTIPDHVYILRGNHEYYVEFNGKIYGGVKPAEAIQSLQEYASQDVFVKFRQFFESIPNMMLFDRIFFVHAGIPREETLARKWKDLSSLNDPEMRFQMMWSDPSEAEVIPEELQKANARFPFGRRQFRSFMERVGCKLMVRGHERVIEGLRANYTDPDAALFTLFSSGGKVNRDLPETSNYREVTPMGLTIRHKDGMSRFTPFELDWQRYNKPETNAFMVT